MVCLELLTEHLRVDFLPFRCSPCRIVYTVGDIAHVELFRKIAWPHVTENVAAHLTVKP